MNLLWDTLWLSILSPPGTVSCSLSKPGRFIQHLGRWKKIHRAFGTPDTPLFRGGVTHAYHKPCHTGKSQLPYILDAHKAGRMPRYYLAILLLSCLAWLVSWEFDLATSKLMSPKYGWREMWIVFHLRLWFYCYQRSGELLVFILLSFPFRLSFRVALNLGRIVSFVLTLGCLLHPWVVQYCKKYLLFVPADT